MSLGLTARTTPQTTSAPEFRCKPDITGWHLSLSFLGVSAKRRIFNLDFEVDSVYASYPLQRSTSASACLGLRLAAAICRAQLMKLRGEQALAITLCRITAVAIAPTDLPQFVVKVSNSRLAASLSGFRLLPLGVVCVVVVGVFQFW